MLNLSINQHYLEAYHWKIRSVDLKLTIFHSDTCFLWEDCDKNCFFLCYIVFSYKLPVSKVSKSMKRKHRDNKKCVWSKFYLKLISVGTGELLFWFIYFKTWFLLSCMKTNCILFRSKDFPDGTSLESRGHLYCLIFRPALILTNILFLIFRLIISSPHLESVNK